MRKGDNHKSKYMRHFDMILVNTIFRYYINTNVVMYTRELNYDLEHRSFIYQVVIFS